MSEPTTEPETKMQHKQECAVFDFEGCTSPGVNSDPALCRCNQSSSSVPLSERETIRQRAVAILNIVYEHIDLRCSCVTHRECYAKTVEEVAARLQSERETLIAERPSARKLHMAFNVAMRQLENVKTSACDGPDCLVCLHIERALAMGVTDPARLTDSESGKAIGSAREDLLAREVARLSSQLAGLRTALARSMWINTLCGACGNRYRQCRGCSVGVSVSLEGIGSEDQCRGHRSTPCTPSCYIAAALAASQERDTTTTE